MQALMHVTHRAARCFLQESPQTLTLYMQDGDLQLFGVPEAGVLDNLPAAEDDTVSAVASIRDEPYLLLGCDRCARDRRPESQAVNHLPAAWCGRDLERHHEPSYNCHSKLYNRSSYTTKPRLMPLLPPVAAESAMLTHCVAPYHRPCPVAAPI